MSKRDSDSIVMCYTTRAQFKYCKKIDLFTLPTNVAEFHSKMMMMMMMSGANANASTTTSAPSLGWLMQSLLCRAYGDDTRQEWYLIDLVHAAPGTEDRESEFNRDLAARIRGDPKYSKHVKVAGMLRAYLCSYKDRSSRCAIPEKLDGTSVVLYVSHRDQSRFADVMSIVMALAVKCRNLLIAMPYFSTSTQERTYRLSDGLISIDLCNSYASMMAGHLKYCPHAQVLVYDIHNRASQAAWNGVAKFMSAIPAIVKRMISDASFGDAIIAYPDDGSRKRFEMYKEELNALGTQSILCAKERTGEDEKKMTVTSACENSRRRHFVIIDDIVQSGGTLAATIDYLKEQKALSITLIIVHVVMPTDDAIAVLDKCDKIYVSNSVPRSYDLHRALPQKVALVGLADGIIDEMLLRK